MTKEYRITNESYSQDACIVTAEEFQVHVDELARTDETWRCRFAECGDTLIDELNSNVVVGMLATNGEVMEEMNDRLLAHSKTICTPGCLGCMDRWQREGR